MPTTTLPNSTVKGDTLIEVLVLAPAPMPVAALDDSAAPAPAPFPCFPRALDRGPCQHLRPRLPARPIPTIRKKPRQQRALGETVRSFAGRNSNLNAHEKFRG